MKPLTAAAVFASCLSTLPACGLATVGPAEPEDVSVESVSVESADDPQAAESPDGEGPASQPAGCDASHPLVGSTGTLSTLFHDVAGEVTVLDDCTLLVEHFTYDGSGLDVRLWAGTGGAFDDGIPLSRNLLRFGGYADETLELTLPADVTLDDFDSVSVWCVTVGVSFGDTVLAAD